MQSSINDRRRIVVDITATAKARILVVDDSSLVRLYYRHALEKAGFEVEQAINGIEAMERVLTQSFDLLIIDVNMPRMDGFTFLRSLRCGAADTSTVPTLMISTESETQDAAEARASGANFYLVKPVSEAELVRHVAVLTGAGP
jgi:two-component system chemotaxis response regulator CheY